MAKNGRELSAAFYERASISRWVAELTTAPTAREGALMMRIAKPPTGYYQIPTASLGLEELRSADSKLKTSDAPSSGPSRARIIDRKL